MNGMYVRISKFTKVLFKLPKWTMFEIKPWLLESKFSNLKGKHSKSFTQNIECIVNTLWKILPEEKVGDVCEGILL